MNCLLFAISSTLFIVFGIGGNSVRAVSVYNRYNPLATGNGKEYIRKSVTQKVYIEVLESRAMSPAMLADAQQSIAKHFTNIVHASGYESLAIANDLERKYGGVWAVYIYDSNYDIAFTTTRRATTYALIAADDRVILLAKEGGGGGGGGGGNKHRRLRVRQ